LPLLPTKNQRETFVLNGRIGVKVRAQARQEKGGQVDSRLQGKITCEKSAGVTWPSKMNVGCGGPEKTLRWPKREGGVPFPISHQKLDATSSRKGKDDRAGREKKGMKNDAEEINSLMLRGPSERQVIALRSKEISGCQGGENAIPT